VPSQRVPTVAQISYDKLSEAGCKYIVFDKDNTITAPYKQEYFSAEVKSAVLENQHFETSDMAVISNSAGCSNYDPDYKKAVEAESKLGISFIRHQ